MDLRFSLQTLLVSEGIGTLALELMPQLPAQLLECLQGDLWFSKTDPKIRNDVVWEKAKSPCVNKTGKFLEEK